MSGRSGGGRGTVRTDEAREMILRALRLGATREAAAGVAGMSVRTLERWCVADVAVQRACAEAESTAEMRHTGVVADDAFGRPAQYDDQGRMIRAEVKPNPESSKWWLERRRPRTWGKRIAVDVRATIERYAAENGLDPEDLMAEAERVLAEHAEQYR